MDVLITAADGEELSGIELLVFFTSGVGAGSASLWTFMSCMNGCGPCAAAKPAKNTVKATAKGQTANF
jgi:hypothetical protein